MRVVTLASGSSGNATLVTSGQTAVLVDAGVNARLLIGRLRKAGCDPASLRAVMLTHEHGDHTTGAATLARHFNIPLMGDPRTLAAVIAADRARNIVTENGDAAPAPVGTEPHPIGTTWKTGDLEITSFPVPHDAAAPCGYVVASAAWRACVMTDCGEVTAVMVEHLRRANVLVLEANHDRLMLLHGPYPPSLKHRILSATGHLSNDQAAEALWQCLDGDPRWVWLAHLSRTNNTPEMAREAVARRLGARRMREVRLQVAPPGFGQIWDSAALLHVK